MSIPYLHTATITRLGVVAIDDPRDDFGQPVTPATNTEIYSGVADYQDMNFREKREAFGTESVDSFGWLYTPESAWPTDVRTDDTAAISGEGVSVSGVIVDVDRLSYRVLLKLDSQPTDI